VKINCKVCKNRTVSLPAIKAMTLVIGIILLASAANGTVSPLLIQSKQQAFAQQAFAETEPGSVLKLARTNVPIDIPLLEGYENGNEIYFIATDVSDEKVATFATNLTGFKINYAPALSQTPDSARTRHMRSLTESLAMIPTDFKFQLQLGNQETEDIVHYGSLI
jgi:hypothetical protein